MLLLSKILAMLGVLGTFAILGILLLGSGYNECQVLNLTFVAIGFILGGIAIRPASYPPRP